MSFFLVDGLFVVDMKCEIKFFCFGGCEFMELMMVDLDFNVIFNCLIIERLELGMMWKCLVNCINFLELYFYYWSLINNKNYLCVCIVIFFICKFLID